MREVIPHIGPIHILISLRLFLDDINFPADNVTACVTWKFRAGEKVQQILYDVILRFQNCLIKLSARYRFQTYILGIAKLSSLQ